MKGNKDIAIGCITGIVLSIHENNPDMSMEDILETIIGYTRTALADVYTRNIGNKK